MNDKRPWERLSGTFKPAKKKPSTTMEPKKESQDTGIDWAGYQSGSDLESSSSAAWSVCGAQGSVHEAEDSSGAQALRRTKGATANEAIAAFMAMNNCSTEAVNGDGDDYPLIPHSSDVEHDSPSGSQQRQRSPSSNSTSCMATHGSASDTKLQELESDEPLLCPVSVEDWSYNPSRRPQARISDRESPERTPWSFQEEEAWVRVSRHLAEMASTSDHASASDLEGTTLVGE